MRGSSPTFETPAGETSSPLSLSAGLPREPFATLLLLGFSLLLYVTTTGHEFVVDDNLLLAHNPYVLSLHYVREIFTQDFWSFLGARGETGFYRPLVMLTLLGERMLFGLRPAGYHLVNVVLNAVVAVLVYRLARALWREGGGAFWAGLLFSVLPVHTENVAPVSGISDLQCALFMLLAAAIYMRPVDSRGHLPGRSSWLAGVLFLLAALAKEVALVLPVLVVFYEHFLRPSDDRVDAKERVGRYVPMLMLATLYLAARIAVFRGFAKLPGGHNLDLKTTIASGFSLLGQYCYKLVWPRQLTYFLTFHPPQAWYDRYVLLGTLFVLLAAAAFFRCWRRQRAVSFAVLWFFLTLGPVLNARWVGASAYGERYLYIPSIAFCWLVGEGLARLRGSKPEGQAARWILAPGLALLLVVVLAARTLARLPDWKNNGALALATLREDPDSGMYHVYLGNAFREQGERGLARKEYVAALALDPSIGEAYLNLAGVLMDDGAVDAARELMKRAVKANPRFPETFHAWGLIELGQGERGRARKLFERAVALNPNYCDALNNLGVMSLEDGKLEEAQGFLTRAVRADPRSLDAAMNLGAVLAQKGDFVRAEAQFRHALQLAPTSAVPYLSLATLNEQQGKQPAALEMYRLAVRVQADSANAQFRLGVLALKMGNVAEATRALERAAALQANSPLAHTQLGLAYLAAGDRSGARREIETGVRLNPNDEAAKAALHKLD
jgi:tetratricopeptide (TPR) repeat protein